jgi:hypothetical protein
LYRFNERPLTEPSTKTGKMLSYYKQINEDNQEYAVKKADTDDLNAARRDESVKNQTRENLVPSMKDRLH